MCFQLKSLFLDYDENLQKWQNAKWIKTASQKCWEKVVYENCGMFCFVLNLELCFNIMFSLCMHLSLIICNGDVCGAAQTMLAVWYSLMKLKWCNPFLYMFWTIRQTNMSVALFFCLFSSPFNSINIYIWWCRHWHKVYIQFGYNEPAALCHTIFISLLWLLSFWHDSHIYHFYQMFYNLMKREDDRRWFIGF